MAFSAENVSVASPKTGITILEQNQYANSHETEIASHCKSFSMRFSRESGIRCTVRRLSKALLTNTQASVSRKLDGTSHELHIRPAPCSPEFGPENARCNYTAFIIETKVRPRLQQLQAALAAQYVRKSLRGSHRAAALDARLEVPCSRRLPIQYHFL